MEATLCKVDVCRFAQGKLCANSIFYPVVVNQGNSPEPLSEWTKHILTSLLIADFALRMTLNFFLCRQSSYDKSNKTIMGKHPVTIDIQNTHSRPALWKETYAYMFV